MTSIVTVTLNPSIDAASETDKVQHTRKVRTTNEIFDPGGGGINVARMVAELGGEVLALYLAGGPTGAVFDSLIESCGIPARRIDIADATRISHTVRERSSGHEYRFVPEGPEIREGECRRLLAVLEEISCDYLVASGSLPRGVPPGFYAEIAAIARRKSARFVLDSSGAGLRAAIEAGGIHLVKPSLGEFEALVGRELPTPEAQREAAQAIVASGKVELLAVTLGHRGALLAHREGVLRLPAMDVEARSAVGAGDSFVAGMTLGLVRGMPPARAFRLGMAAGTAAVLTPGTDLARRADVERLFKQLETMRAAAE